jgi:hypothetical protein
MTAYRAFSALMILLAAGCGGKSDLWDPVPAFVGDGEDAPDVPTDGDAHPEGTETTDPAADDGPESDVNLCELPCDDGIACTEDRCEPATGCVFEAVHERCDDGIDCTRDRCVTGAGCVSTADDALCSDGADCTLDRCDTAAGGCTHATRDELCADGIDCTEDLCTPFSGCSSTPVDARCGPGERCDPACRGCILDVAPAGRFLAHSEASLYQVDPSVPASLYIGEIGYSVTDIAVTTDNMLWGITYGALISIDYCTGVGAYIGDVGSTATLNALVSAPGGALFAADAQGDVWRVNPATGRGTLIGNYGTGLSSSGDLAYGPDGRLYGTVFASWSPTDLLIAVDPASGRATLVGDTGFDDVFGLAVLAGVLYGLTADGFLITLDMTSGRGTFAGDLGPSFWGAASPP